MSCGIEETVQAQQQQAPLCPYCGHEMHESMSHGVWFCIGVDRQVLPSGQTVDHICPYRLGTGKQYHGPGITLEYYKLQHQDRVNILCLMRLLTGIIADPESDGSTITGDKLADLIMEARV